MTTTTRRRGRRSLAAILAAMLMASVLAVVAGSPAQAANTSSEVLNADGEREFGGRDRYDTALRLATNFAEGKGGLGNVPIAFVASGYSLVDAVSVTGLAGFFDAPVLLTASDSLHGGVADFIEDYGVDNIYVLGGSGAVADTVLEDMEALANEPTVSRIAGADRYATAAAAASKLGGGAAWCGAEDPAALLVNGGDVSLVEAMMVGPIAHRLQLPLLMTAADELSMATADFIEAEDIEHVVIVGGTDAVSDDVGTALSDSGVDTVDRIAGDTAAATSVELTKLAFNGCADDLAPVSGNTIALVNRDGLPDGVAASPVLSSTYRNGDLVPILVVGSTLPASVREYLAATPSEDGDGNKVNLGIVAIGGTAAVSQSVMDAAVAAAASADALTVQIGAWDDPATTDVNEGDTNGDGKATGDDTPKPGADMVTLYFSDDVIGADAGLAGKIRDIIELNGAPARLAAEPAAPTGNTDKCLPDQVTVQFARRLKAGDTIAVAASTLELGASDDKRDVVASSVTIPAPPVDRTRPTVSVVAIVGQPTAWVTITEENAGDDNELTVTTDEDNEVVLRSADTDKTVVVAQDGNLTIAPALQAGDRITITSGAIVDKSGNRSLQRSFTAIAPQKSPRITSVLMSNLKHSAQATSAVPDDIAGVTHEINISAKVDGSAAGAAGNAWSFVYDVASTWEDDAEAAIDIDVRVNSRDTTVFVRFNTGKAKFGDLKAALEGNSAFDSMFEVELPANIDAGCTATFNELLDLGTTDRQVANDPPTASGGVTEVAIEVRFNGYVRTVAHDELLSDVLEAAAGRVRNTTTDPAETLAAAIERVRDDTDGLTLDSPTAFEGPKTTVRYEATTGDADMLPEVRDLVNTDAGADLVTADPNANPPVLAKDAVVSVALGYAPDTDNEGKNARSQVRIGRSSGVDQPGD